MTYAWSLSDSSRTAQCAASVVLCSEVEREPAGFPAWLGDEAHRWLRAAAVGDDVPTDVHHKAMAFLKGITPEQVREHLGLGTIHAEVSFAYAMRARRARVLGYNLARDYSGCLPGETPGTADIVVQRPDGSAYVPDWKTGKHLPEPTCGQLSALACAADLALGPFTEVTVAVVSVRGQGLVPYSHVYARAALDAEIEKWARVDADVAGQFSRRRMRLPLAPVPGPECGYCRGFSLCFALWYPTRQQVKT